MPLLGSHSRACLGLLLHYTTLRHSLLCISAGYRSYLLPTYGTYGTFGTYLRYRYLPRRYGTVGTVPPGTYELYTAVK